MAYNTSNPLGSTDPRDLSDNSENFDRAVNNTSSPTWTDRFGNTRTTLAGQIGYIGTGVDGAIESYAPGLVLTTYNTIIEYNGEFFRPSASSTLPYTTTATLPDADSNLVAVGDAVLRQDLANSSASLGASLVSMEGGPSVEVAVNKRTIYIGSVAELSSVNTGLEPFEVSTLSFWDGENVGGSSFMWDVNRSKTDHNGGTVIDPDRVSELGAVGNYGSYFSPAVSGTGCFVSVDETRFLSAAVFGLVDGGDLSIILDALVAAYSDTGFYLNVPFNLAEFRSALPTLENVTISGLGIESTQINKTFDGDLCVGFSNGSELKDLYLFGENRPGELLVMPTGSANQNLSRVKMRGTAEKMVVFEQDGGLSCHVRDCTIGNTSTTIAGIASRGGYQEAGGNNRHFLNNESAGGVLYDFSGMNDIYVSGGYTQGLLFDDLTAKVFINNMRWGVSSNPAMQTYEIRGENLGITNVTASVPTGEHVDLYCTGSRIDIVVSRWDIRDFGSGNSVEIKEQAYTPTFSGLGATLPDIGDGNTYGRWARNGNQVTVQIEVAFGSTTTAGDGEWEFSLPPNTSPVAWAAPSNVCGSGLTVNSGGEEYHVICEVRPSWGGVRLRAIDSTGARVVLGGGTKSWSSSTAIRFQFTFATV